MRSWPGAKKISFVLAGFGTRAIFLKTDLVTHVFGQVSNTRWESEALAVACENSICQAEGRIGLSFFSEMGVVTKGLAQAWDPTWKNEVPAIG